MIVTIDDFRGRPHCSGAARLVRALSTCRRIAVIGFVIAASAIPRTAQAQSLNEYEIKAGFLFNFVRFIEWPDKAFVDSSSPLIIGVVGDDRSSAVIEQVITGKTANGRRLVVKRFSDFKSLTSCHIVFVRSADTDRIRQTLSAAGPSALTVGENEGFAKWGGIINFTIVGGKLRLEINQTAAERAGLKISAKLLSLARIIKD